MKQSYWYGIIISVLSLFLVGYGQYSVRHGQQEIKINQVRNQFELVLADGKHRINKMSELREKIKDFSPTPTLSNLYDTIYRIEDDSDLGIVLNNFWLIPILSSKNEEYISYYVSGSDYDQLNRVIADTQEFVYHYNVDHINANGNNNYDVCLTGAFGYEQQNSGSMIHPNAPVRGPYPIDACIPIVLDQGKISINQEKFQKLIKQKESQ